MSLYFNVLSIMKALFVWSVIMTENPAWSVLNRSNGKAQAHVHHVPRVSLELEHSLPTHGNSFNPQPPCCPHSTGGGT